MLTLALIGLVGGLITGVSPCVLPMLPILFFAGGSGEAGASSAGAAPSKDREFAAAGSGGSTAVGADRSEPLVDRVSRGDHGPERDWRPLKIIAGVVTSFSIVTLLGSTILSLLGLPDDFLRWTGIVVLGLVGLGFIVPALGHLIEKPFYRLPKLNTDNSGPFVLGLGLGTLYVPCAGPILAAITVAGATGQIGLRTVVLTISFAIGAALPLLVFAAAGANIRRRINAYRRRAQIFRTVAGVVLIALAIGLAFNLPSVLQRAVPNYTKPLEDRVAESSAVQGALTPEETDENKDLDKCEPGADELASCGKAPALRGTQKWFNTPGGEQVSLDDLRGKVVMLDFFAYSCINCQRDQPYIQDWYEAYESKGLTVIGVHSPEFAFEKSAGNLQSAVEKEGTTYPVVQDYDLDTWTAYRNRYWPAKYLIDADGTVRAIKFGEGDYEQTESLLRELLTEADPDTDLPEPVTGAADSEITADRTPELYLANNKPGYAGDPRYISTSQKDYLLNAEQPRNSYSLGGRWKVENERIVAREGSQVRLHFSARNVYHVLSGNGTVTVSRPGREDNVIEVSGTPNLYPLVEEDQPVDETLTITYSAGVQAYTFTFG